jgi:ankyrin repeat protein
MTPAHLAVVGGHNEALQMLLSAGANVNAKGRYVSVEQNDYCDAR